MTEVTFHGIYEISDDQIRFSVIAARYQNQWVFCCHKLRTTWEIPGGHREHGEPPMDAARRELWEETGAVRADIRPVCVYNVVRNGTPSYGMLFYADILSLSRLHPDSEMNTIQLFDTIPGNLTYPDIQPHLYNRVQGWLNVQSNAGELWDVYDEWRNLTGGTHRRGDPLNPGAYHLVVHVWIRNSRGEFLLTKRSPNKGFPNMWETTGGSALSGDDSLTSAIREVREETGMILNPENGTIVHQYSGADYHTDVWLFCHDFDLDAVILQEGETCDKMAASLDKIEALYNAGQLVPFRYLHDVILKLTDI